MGNRIEDPECICNCECCEGDCAPTAFTVTFAGVANLAPAVCGNCVDWNRGFRFEQTARGSNCFWSAVDVLPCSATQLVLAIECPRADTGLFGIELEVWETDPGPPAVERFVGSFQRFAVAPQETTDCFAIGAIGAFVKSATPDIQCDWSGATATVTVP
jgi:hypothetical protein